MRIDTDFPFPWCDQCSEFLLNVNEQTVVLKDGSFRQITVRCKNSVKCKYLKKNIEKHEKANA